MKHKNYMKSAYSVARERKIGTELRHDIPGTGNKGDIKTTQKCATHVETKKKRKRLLESISKVYPDGILGHPIRHEKIKKKKKGSDWDALREEVENSLHSKAHKKRKKELKFKSSSIESFNLKRDKEFETNNSSFSVAANSAIMDIKEKERIAPSGKEFHESRLRSMVTNERSGSENESDGKSGKRSQFCAEEKPNRKPRSRREKREQKSQTKSDWCRSLDKNKNFNSASNDNTHSPQDSGNNINLNKDSEKLNSSSNSDFKQCMEFFRKDISIDSVKTTSRDISKSRSQKRKHENSKHISPETPEGLTNNSQDIQMENDSNKRKRHTKFDKMKKENAVLFSTEGFHRKLSRKEKETKNSMTFDGDQDDRCQKSDEYLSRRKMELDESFGKEKSMAFETSTGAVLVVCHPQEFCVKGRVAVRVIMGAVSILGYTLTQSQKFRNIFSPESNSLLTIKTVSATDDICEVLSQTKALVLRSDQIEQSLKYYKGHNVVVLQFKKLESYDHLTTFSPFQNLFGKCVDNCEGMNMVLSPLGINLHELPQFRKESRFPILGMTKDYQNVMDLLTDLLSKGDLPQPVIVTCGGKNSGKSTLNRLLVNSGLQQVDKLCYLECDLGQTEFTPPGCVSLHLLTKPVFGPPFTHQKRALSCCFHGDLSPSSDPDWYLKCIWHVLQFYHQMPDSVPLIVNTMGWVKGLGLQLLLDILRMVKPTLVIQLNRINQTQNCSSLTPQLVAAKQSWSQISGSSTTWEVNSLNYQLIGIESVFESTVEHQIKLRPVDHRNLTLLSYLCQTVEPGITLYSMVPTVLSWCSIALHVSHTCVPKSQVMYAINASVVALCSADLSKAYRLHEESPLFFQKTPAHQCLGFGFIRCIDQERKLLYLVTPLSFKKLEKVNTLIKGAVTLPDSLLFNQKSGLEQAYVDDSLTTLGASSLKQRRRMPRRYVIETP